MTKVMLAPTPFDLALSDIEAALKAHGHGGLLKRRDHREPLRRQKEAAEEKLARLLFRYWHRQRRRIAERLTRSGVPVKGQAADYILSQFDDAFWEDTDGEMLAALLDLLYGSAAESAAAAAALIKPAIDPTIINTQAAAWARAYSWNWLQKLDDTTRDALKEAVAAFIETPGVTVGDVMKQLAPVFGEARAMSEATTEITRAYARGNQVVADALVAEFPDVRVVKTWFTNNDARVCPVCAPLDGKTVDHDELFPADVEGDLLLPPAHRRCRCWTQVTTEIE